MGRREENKAKKREAILSEGLGQFLEHGYDRTSIEQIAAAAGIARGTYYLYFDDKLALFAALVDQWFEPLLDLMAEVQGQLEEATHRAESFAIYRDMALALAVQALSNQQAVLLAFREMRHSGEAGDWLRAREQALQESVIALTEVARVRGLIDVDDARVASLIVMGAVERLFFEFLTGTELGDPLSLARSVVALFGRMLGLPTDAVAEG